LDISRLVPFIILSCIEGKKKVLTKLLQEVNLKDKKVLDVGCGIGVFIKWYIDRGAIVSGMDISSTAIDRLSIEYPKVHFENRDFSVPFQQTEVKYDIIHVWDVIYHQVEEQSFRNFLKNVSLSCKRGGIVMISDGLGFETSFQAAPHVLFRPVAAYENILSSLGFQLEQQIPLYALLNKKMEGIPFRRVIYDFMAPALYTLDNIFCNKNNANLWVGLWRKL
jgi:SAM-dependent methyltransferase